MTIEHHAISESAERLLAFLATSIFPVDRNTFTAPDAAPAIVELETAGFTEWRGEHLELTHAGSEYARHAMRIEYENPEQWALVGRIASQGTR